MSSGAGGEATKALKRTGGTKFYVSKETRDEYNDSNRITKTRKQAQQYKKKQRQNKRATRKYGVQRMVPYPYKEEEEEEYDFPKLKF